MGFRFHYRGRKALLSMASRYFLFQSFPKKFFLPTPRRRGEVQRFKGGMRYTFYCGLSQVSNWVRLKFAAMNLKKPAKWKAKRQRSALH